MITKEKFRNEDSKTRDEEAIVKTKIETKLVKLESDSSVICIEIDYPTVDNPTLLTQKEAMELIYNLRKSIDELVEINNLRSNLERIDNFLDSLQTSLKAAERQLNDFDILTAQEEINNMNSDLNDLVEIIHEY